MVSISMFAAIIAAFIIAVGVPVMLLIVCRKKWAISIKVVLFGMLTFVVFAFILESTVHSIVLVMYKPTKEFFSNPWMFMLYGGLMAGLFEETGRWLAMKYVLKPFRRWKDGLAFGIGHGGIEAILLVGINSITMLVFAVMINSGSFDALLSNPAASEALQQVHTQLTRESPVAALVGGVERLSAFAIHIALSILVMLAVRRGRIKYLLYAILIHALFDFPAALYQKGVLSNLYAVEAILLLFGAGSVFWIIKSRKMFQEE